MRSPRDAIHLLTDFLNHGLLPFVGREAELDALASFWRAGREAERLRVALLIGEAGAGKSRLLGALGALIRHEGGFELRATLHPEAANALAPHLSSALWYSDCGRMLLREEPDGSLVATIAALRRLARLRPVIVVIEDLHLLGADAVPELARLLDALAGEPLTIVCTARPAAIAARAALQPYLIEDLELHGLEIPAIGELWQRLFEFTPHPAVTDALARLTRGNPLALRSALRCAVRELRSHAALPAEELVVLLARDADLMHEGLVAHLSPELRRAAGRLAHLGEVISRSAASRLVEEADRVLERLVFAGIVVPAATATPALCGRDDGAPQLAFAHSLVHRHLADTTTPDLDALARIVADDIPVFTLLPLELLCASGRDLAGSFDVLLGLYVRMHEAMRALDGRGQWPTVRRMIDLGESLANGAGTRLGAAERRRLDDAVVLDRLSVLRRETGSPRYHAILERALELTADPGDDRAATARLYTLHYAQVTAIREDAPRAVVWGGEIDALIERFPRLAGSVDHVLSLGGQAQTAIALDDGPMLARVERAFGELLDSPSLTAELRSQLLQRVAPPLLLHFATVEQLDDRRLLLERIRKGEGSRTPFVETVITEFLLLAGDFGAALRQARRAHRLCADAGQSLNVVNTRMSQIVAALAISGPDAIGGDAAIDVVVDLLQQVPAVLRDSYAGIACSRLGEAAWLRFDDDFMRRLGSRLLETAPGARLACADRILLDGDAVASLECATFDDGPGEWDRRLARLRSGLQAGIDDATALDDVRELLRPRPASTRDMVRRRAVLELLARHRLSFADSEQQQVRTMMTDGLAHALEWLSTRTLRPSIVEWVRRFDWLLCAQGREGWVGTACACTESTPCPTSSESRIGISMLGEIRFGRGGETSRLRGIRNRTFLGVMVAIEATGRGVTHAEFCRLVTGIEDDAERARKMTNVAVHRLRELLGRDAIDTSGETPRLALDAISVDLLEAIDQIDDCERALRDGIPARAVFAARRALVTLDGEVAWPTLYGAFFEAARDELEIRLRRALVRLGESLLREGDHAGAEEILRRAVESVPGDEELMELLDEAAAAHSTSRPHPLF